MSNFSNFRLYIHKSNPNAVLPRKGYPNSAGYDLFLPKHSTDLAISASNLDGRIHRKAFNLGIRTSFAPGYVALVRDRGSTGSKGIITLAGVVDADYRGDWIIWLANLGDQHVELDINKAIAQVLFIPVDSPEIVEVTSLDSSERGEGRLGSSDAPGVVGAPSNMLHFQSDAILLERITQEEAQIILTGKNFAGKEYSLEYRTKLCDKANGRLT